MWLWPFHPSSGVFKKSVHRCDFFPQTLFFPWNSVLLGHNGLNQVPGLYGFMFNEFTSLLFGLNLKQCFHYKFINKGINGFLFLSKPDHNWIQIIFRVKICIHSILTKFTLYIDFVFLSTKMYWKIIPMYLPKDEPLLLVKYRNEMTI